MSRLIETNRKTRPPIVFTLRSRREKPRAQTVALAPQHVRPLGHPEAPAQNQPGPHGAIVDGLSVDGGVSSSQDATVSGCLTAEEARDSAPLISMKPSDIVEQLTDSSVEDEVNKSVLLERV
jgi:hypothetical protein